MSKEGFSMLVFLGLIPGKLRGHPSTTLKDLTNFYGFPMHANSTDATPYIEAVHLQLTNRMDFLFDYE